VDSCNDIAYIMRSYTSTVMDKLQFKAYDYPNVLQCYIITQI